MAEAIKLEKEHLTEISSLQEKLLENNSALGFTSKEIYAAEQTIEQLKRKQDELLDTYSQLRTSEQGLVEKLKQHYGEGQINVKEGIFIPES